MRPFAAPDLPEAARLLHEGFPTRSEDFWSQALQRLQRHGSNAQAEHALGYFMLGRDGSAVGIALTPASLRRQADGGLRRIVNISSWYVRQEFRWRAGFMLRGILADPETVYTDLTPTPEVQRLLPAVGMQPINCGVAIHALPLLAAQPARGARVRALPPGGHWPGPGPDAALLESHRALGCLPLVLQAEGAEQLLVVQRSQLRGVPAARLVYAQSHRLLLRHAGVLARALLARGLLLLVRSTSVASHSASALFRPRELWFARGDSFEDRTDVLGSELCLILPPRC